MDEDDLVRKLEGLNPPEISAPAHQRQLKLTLLSTSRSSRLGLILVALPCLFICAILLKYQLHLDLSWLTGVEDWMARIDHTWLGFVPPLLLIGAPLVAGALNLLAILHVRLHLPQREVQITLKLKPINLAICAICLLILTVVFLYLVAENSPGHPHSAKPTSTIG